MLGFTHIIDWAYNHFKMEGGGHLVAITSVGGLRGNGLAASYGASKSYQINYLEGLRQMTSSLNLPIDVTDVRPGLVDTKMAMGEGLFWVMPVEKVVEQLYRGINNRKKVIYVTKRWGLIARVLKVLPRFVHDKMLARSS